MPRIRLALILPLLLAAGACADVRMATPQEDQLGKRFEPPPQDKAAIYLYREGILGALAPVTVQVAVPSGGLDVSLAYDTWVRLEGDPGPLEVRCAGDQQGMRLDIRPGETRYIEVSYRMAFKLSGGGCAVAEVSPQQGQRGVANGRRAIAGGGNAQQN